MLLVVENWLEYKSRNTFLTSIEILIQHLTSMAGSPVLSLIYRLDIPAC